jgi:hypothetical protein
MKETMLDNTAELFQNGDSQGDYALRETVRDYLHRSRGVNCSADQIIIGAGTDYLLMLLTRLLPGYSEIGMENPVYQQAYRVFQNFNYKIHPIPLDENGLQIASLRETGAKLVAFSSDQVYAGVEQSGPLPETIPLKPANVYGQDKLEMEQRVQALCPGAVLLRATWMYDLPGYRLPIRGNLPLNILRAAKTGEVLRFSRNDYRGVGYVREVIENLVPAMELPGGVYNFGSECDGNMVETARCFANLLQVDVKIEESDLTRNLAMDTGKLRAHGIEFSSTWGALRVCLGDYRLGYLM